MKRKISKKYKLMLLVLVIGLIISVITLVKDLNESEIRGDNSIQRNWWNKGDKQILVNAKAEKFQRMLKVDISERSFSEEELILLSNAFESILNEEIKARNSDLYSVNSNLSLKNKVTGYPFSIFWSSDSDEIVDSKGIILCEKDCKEDHDVILNAKIKYHDFTRDFSIPIHIIHDFVGYEDDYFTSLERELKRIDVDSVYNDSFVLPSEYMGQKIIWKEANTGVSRYVFGATLAMVILVSLAYEYDEKKKTAMIEEELAGTYPSFVEKLKLYLEAGLTTRNSFIELAKDVNSIKYSSNRLKSETQIAVNRFQNGVKEEEVYDLFGKACGGPYKKLCFLLIINLKQGNDKILNMMNEEVNKAFSYRKDYARKKADEASIKLLFPMVLLLMVVMALIMIPAYLDF